MASIQWDKQTMQKAGALIKHNGKDERARYDHENTDIDKSRSIDNFFIGCSDYKESYERMKKRVEEVDKQYPPHKITKDRIVCCSLYTPCPQSIENRGAEAIRLFFEKTYELYQNFFGRENVHGMTVHCDEKHEYIDHRTGKMQTSLFHGTALVSAYSEWVDKRYGKVVERKGINGKNFETRARLKALNNEMCDMVRAVFGIEYNTGEHIKGETVEAMKSKSRLLAVKKELKDKEAAVKRAKQQETAYLAQLQENAAIIVRQEEQINDNNEVLLQQNQFIEKIQEDRPDESEVNTADRKAVREFNKKVERWNKNVQGKYNGSVFEKNKENRELSFVNSSQKRKEQSLEQRERSVISREKRCSEREKNIELETQARLKAEMQRAALFIQLMHSTEDWEKRYAEIYSRTKPHAQYLTALEKERSQMSDQERRENYEDQFIQKMQNDHNWTDPKPFDGH